MCLNSGTFTIDSLDYVLEGSWDDSLVSIVFFHAFHGMGLSCSGLPVSEDSAIVSLQNALDDRKGSLLEDPLLRTPWFEGHIEAKHSFLLSSILSTMDHDFSAIGDNIDDRLVLMLELPR